MRPSIMAFRCFRLEVMFIIAAFKGPRLDVKLKLAGFGDTRSLTHGQTELDIIRET